MPSASLYVLPPAAADASQETIDRIVHQIVTNDQKRDLTNAQRARGIQQMIDAGMSVTKVAKRGLSPHQVLRPPGRLYVTPRRFSGSSESCRWAPHR